MTLDDTKFVVQKNVQRFETLLASERDPAMRRTLRQLLKEERAKFEVLLSQPRQQQ